MIHINLISVAFSISKMQLTYLHIRSQAAWNRLNNPSSSNISKYGFQNIQDLSSNDSIISLQVVVKFEDSACMEGRNHKEYIFRSSGHMTSVRINECN